jgi:site-specific recombinase XerC
MAENRYNQVGALFSVITNLRDKAMFMLMLRCGLRVEEIANLSPDAIGLRKRRLLVFNGKGGKDKVVYESCVRHKHVSERLRFESAPGYTRLVFPVRLKSIRKKAMQFFGKFLPSSLVIVP